jgi:4-amino-4-deoxychorismate lyase
MYRLIESIRLENGRFSRLSYHQKRMDVSLRACVDHPLTIDLTRHLLNTGFPDRGLYKCRIVYDVSGILKTEFIPYTQATVSSLKIIHANSLEYSSKWEDRTHLNQLYAQRGRCDDILMVRNGLVTDTSYSNIIFTDGHVRLTPAQPLLKGTMRQYLLDAGEIQEEEIRLQYLSSFTSVQLINAMIELNTPEIPVTNIVV